MVNGPAHISGGLGTVSSWGLIRVLLALCNFKAAFEASQVPGLGGWGDDEAVQEGTKGVNWNMSSQLIRGL